MAKKAAIVVVCALAIGLAVYTLVRPPGRIPKVNPEDYRRPWVCEACAHTFLEVPGTGARECPKYKQKRAVQAIIYVCGNCGHEFEAYRMKDYYDAETGTDETGQPVLPMAYYRKPRGEWTTDAAQLGPVVCPNCNNDAPTTLREKAYGPGTVR